MNIDSGKRYALTGHTGGIGAHLFQHLPAGSLGFSRSLGYDINRRADRDRIIAESSEVDIFINNASDGFGQVQLFVELLQNWRDQDKTIINVGSRVAEIILPEHRLELMKYQSEKLILREMSLRVPSGIRCRVNYRWFGYVGTERILKKYPHFTPDNYITVEQACEIILS